MTENSVVLLSYRRTWQWQLVSSLTMTVVSLVLLPVIWLMFSRTMSVLLLVPGGCAAISGWIAYRMLLFKQDITCELNESELSCRYPGETMGESFTVPLDAIVEIIKKDRDSGPPEYTIHTCDGRRHGLSGNYGVPSYRIIKAICQQRPDLHVVDERFSRC